MKNNAGRKAITHPHLVGTLLLYVEGIALQWEISHRANHVEHK